MSISSRLVYLYFKWQKRYSKEYWEETIKNTTTPQVPPKPKKLECRISDNVYYFNENSSSDTLMFYIHGGAYVNTFTKYHFRLIRKIIKMTDIKVVSPNYDLIPFSNAQKMNDFLVKTYLKVIEEKNYKKIIFMGDSAGAALCLTTYLTLLKMNKRIPDRSFLLSPCVDVSLSNPLTYEYAKVDPWLYLDRINTCANFFVGDLSKKDYVVSPTYGDVEKLENLTIFLGTKEILYPDITDFYDKLDKTKNNELIIKKNMIHVYPLLPIKEAKEALKYIASEIKKIN